VAVAALASGASSSSIQYQYWPQQQQQQQQSSSSAGTTSVVVNPNSSTEDIDGSVHKLSLIDEATRRLREEMRISLQPTASELEAAFEDQGKLQTCKSNITAALADLDSLKGRLELAKRVCDL
jgi:hypothetical protein